MRLLHGARRRRRARRLRDPGGSGGAGGRSRPSRASTRRSATRSRPASSITADRSAASAPPGSSCAPRPCGRRVVAARVDLDRALAAHLCRCTGWETVYEAIGDARSRRRSAARRAAAPRDGPSSKAEYRSGWVPRSRSARAASPTTVRRETRSSRCRSHPVRRCRRPTAAGVQWVVADSLHEARTIAAKVQGRRTTAELTWPLDAPAASRGRRAARHRLGGARLPRARRVVVRTGRNAGVTARERRRVRRQGDAPWSPASPASSPTTPDARCAWCSRGRTSCGSGPNVRRSPRPRVFDGRRVVMDGVVAGPVDGTRRRSSGRTGSTSRARGASRRVPGPPTASHLRAVGFAERAVLLEGALAEAGVDRVELARDERVAGVLLDTCARAASGATRRRAR